MKFSEWAKDHDKGNPGKLRVMDHHELLSITEWNNQPERSKREDSQNIDEWLNSSESKKGTVEFGTCSGIRFMTSEGEKEMQPGKRYDKNLNEL